MTDYAHDLRVAVGVELREERERAGLSRPRLAERAGVSEGFIADLENGKESPAFFRVAGVAEALGVSFSDVVRRAEERACRQRET